MAVCKKSSILTLYINNGQKSLLLRNPWKHEQDCLNLFDGTPDDSQHFSLFVFFMTVWTAYINISRGTIHLQFCFSKSLPKSIETLGAQFTVGSLINVPCYFAVNMRPFGKFSNLHFPIGKLVKLLMNIGTTGHSSISLPFFGRHEVILVDSSYIISCAHLLLLSKKRLRFLMRTSFFLPRLG